jgi:phospholipase C
MALSDIETFVIVIMENRSFDHVSGYLALPDSNFSQKINGLQSDPSWTDRFDNDDEDGTRIALHRLDASFQNIIDPPHEDINICTQINMPTHGKASPLMGGFVKSYLDAKPKPADRSSVMGYYDQNAVPVFRLFRSQFCDL